MAVQTLKLLAVVFALCAAPAVLAGNGDHGSWRGGWGDHPGRGGDAGGKRAVPEFDPAAAGALAALVAGGALYVASRKKS
jgi:hypothetical protein